MDRTFVSRATRMLAVVLCFLSAAPAQSRPRGASAVDDGFIVRTGPGEIKVMSYNVENLFDTLDDPGKDDATFLPLNHPAKARGCEREQGNYKAQCLRTDWVDSKLALKISQIRRAILANGDLPDILILVEVENANVVSFLSRALGYRDFRISEGPDRRGIDNVVLWRTEKLRYLSHAELPVPNLDTRPVLKVRFAAAPAANGGQTAELVVFANHWPSQAAPPQFRVGAAAVVRREIERDMARSPLVDRYHALALGDFNTRPDESPNAINDVLRDRSWGQALEDAHELSDASDNPMKRFMPPGTYFFARGGWRRFDRILMTRNLRDRQGMELIPESLRVVAASFMLEDAAQNRIPMRYDFDATTPASAGFSDHLPISVKFKLP